MPADFGPQKSLTWPIPAWREWKYFSGVLSSWITRIMNSLVIQHSSYLYRLFWSTARPLRENKWQKETLVVHFWSRWASFLELNGFDRRFENEAFDEFHLEESFLFWCRPNQYWSDREPERSSKEVAVARLQLRSVLLATAFPSVPFTFDNEMMILPW